MATFAHDPMTGDIWQNVVDAARSGGANWQAAGGVFRIFENRAYCEYAGVVYHKAVPPAADYAVRATYHLKTDMSTVGIAGRIATSGTTYYTAYYSDSKVVLAKMVSGALSVLATIAQPWVAGAHDLRLEMVGTGLGVFWDDVQVITTTDASITAAGYAGIRSGAPNDAHIGKHIDTFWAMDDTTLALPAYQMVIPVGI